ncbi:MAG: cysteine desulfurase family protein [Proteobacteria bacterium]|nr:cysteine desulfurase family protein [Pseudomonadota bacterium]
MHKSHSKNIYLDHNATSYICEDAYNAMISLLRLPLNPSSVHHHGRIARHYLEHARQTVREMIGANSNFKVIFTASGTEANNLALNGIENRRILISAIEHPSVFKAIKDADIISVNSDGVVNLEHLENLLIQNKDTKPIFISVILANNETGVIQPIKEVARLAKQYNAILHTDGSQCPSRILINIDDLGIDLITLSSHKIGGPPGVGALVVRDTIDLTPIIKGGGQEYRIRSGTHNVAAIYAFAVACSLANKRIHAFQSHVLELRNYIEAELLDLGAIIFGYNAMHRLPNTSSIGMNGLQGISQVIYFDNNGISVSAGSACSSGSIGNPYIQTAMGFNLDIANTAIRVSLSDINTKSEIESFIAHWRKLKLSKSNV